MQNKNAYQFNFISSFLKNFDLISSLVKREIIGRYRGSMAGLAWAFLIPILMLTVYTFVFSEVFKARWHTDSSSKTEFALALFAGLIVFNIFSDCINRAPGMVVTNANYVKKVIFPIENLAWVAMGGALFHAIISLIVWLCAFVLFFGIPHATVLLFPFAILPLVFFTMGASWLVAALGVYLRDIGQLIGVLTTVLMFMTPIFYPIANLPEKYQSWMMLNPLTLPVEQVRDLLLMGKLPDLAVYLGTLGASILIAMSGYFIFQNLRKGFADVL